MITNFKIFEQNNIDSEHEKFLVKLIHENDFETIKEFIKNEKIDLNEPYDNRTYLYIGNSQNLEMVKFLMNLGANPLKKNGWGNDLARQLIINELSNRKEKIKIMIFLCQLGLEWNNNFMNILKDEDNELYNTLIERFPEKKEFNL